MSRWPWRLGGCDSAVAASCAKHSGSSLARRRWAKNPKCRIRTKPRGSTCRKNRLRNSSSARLFRCGGVRDFSKRVKPGDGVTTRRRGIALRNHGSPLMDVRFRLGGGTHGWSSMDWQRSVHRGKLVYDLLTDCGRRTTKTVWPFRPRGSGPLSGDTLEEISLSEHHYQSVFGRRMKATQKESFWVRTSSWV